MRLENISFSYNGSEKIFDNVNFTLEYGDFVLLSGVSGEGKSTLLSIINGMIPFITPGKLEGKIYVNSEDVTDVRVSERARLIGTVLQNADEQIVYDIVRDEIAFGCENLDIPVETIDRRIEASTNMMKISPDAKTRTMSGGQKQRLITASTLAMKQKIIILDEPLANLDVEGAHVLLGALRSLAKSGYAVLLVEHRLDVVRPYVNKVMWIKDKNVIVSTDKDAVTRSERVIEPENNAHTAGSPVISGRGLVFSAGGRNILDSLDIDVYKGERLVLLGVNGCGQDYAHADSCKAQQAHIRHARTKYSSKAGAKKAQRRVVQKGRLCLSESDISALHADTARRGLFQGIIGAESKGDDRGVRPLGT